MTPGTLHLSSNKKKIAEFIYHSPYLFQTTPPVYPIYLIKEGNRCYLEVSTESAVFQDSDIERLYAQVQEALAAADALQREITWSDWLEIQVTPPTSAHSNLFGINVTITPLKKGVDAAGVEYTYLSNNKVVIPFPKPKRAGESDETVGLGRARPIETEVAYVPATPENLKAIDEFKTRLQTLALQFNRVFSSDCVQDTLNTLLHSKKRAGSLLGINSELG